MGEFFMGIATAIGVGPAAVYLVFGAFVLGLIGVGVGGYVQHRRKRNLEQGITTKVKNKVKGALGLQKDGTIEKARVRDDEKYNKMLAEQKDNVQNGGVGKGVFTENQANEKSEQPKKEQPKVSKVDAQPETMTYPEDFDEELEIDDVVEDAPHTVDSKVVSQEQSM